MPRDPRGGGPSEWTVARRRYDLDPFHPPVETLPPDVARDLYLDDLTVCTAAMADLQRLLPACWSDAYALLLDETRPSARISRPSFGQETLFVNTPMVELAGRPEHLMFVFAREFLRSREFELDYPSAGLSALHVLWDLQAGHPSRFGVRDVTITNMLRGSTARELLLDEAAAVLTNDPEAATHMVHRLDGWNETSPESNPLHGMAPLAERVKAIERGVELRAEIIANVVVIDIGSPGKIVTPRGMRSSGPPPGPNPPGL